MTTYLNWLDKNGRFGKRQNECLNPCNWFLSSPRHTVEYGEHSRHKDVDEDQHPTNIGTPMGKLATFLGIDWILIHLSWFRLRFRFRK